MRKAKQAVWILLIFLIFSSPKLTEKATKFIKWYVMSNFEESPLSFWEQIACRVLAVVVSFTVVGMIFHWVDWYNSTVMRITYFFVSLLVTVAITYILMILEKYTVLICCLLIAVTAIVVVVHYHIVMQSQVVLLQHQLI